MTTIDDQVQGLLDRQAITNVIHAYARSMDRLDRDLGYSVFWPDAVADYGAMFQGTGHGFVDWVLDVHLSFVAHQHRLSNITIWLDGDAASSETYVEATLRSTDGEGRSTDARSLGRYADRWERRNGEWRIIHRTYVHDMDSTVAVRASFPTTGRRDATDPSYPSAG